jgi:outer membrane murein-binding lipoprotein Lpp
LDATTLGSLLVGLGAVVGAVVAFVGKRSENAIVGYSSLTNDLQEERDALKSERAALEAERDALKAELAGLNARLAEVSSFRAADQAELTRLRGIIIDLGGET